MYIYSTVSNLGCESPPPGFQSCIPEPKNVILMVTVTGREQPSIQASYLYRERYKFMIHIYIYVNVYIHKTHMSYHWHKNNHVGVIPFTAVATTYHTKKKTSLRRRWSAEPSCLWWELSQHQLGKTSVSHQISIWCCFKKNNFVDWVDMTNYSASTFPK